VRRRGVAALQQRSFFWQPGYESGPALAIVNQFTAAVEPAAAPREDAHMNRTRTGLLASVPVAAALLAMPSAAFAQSGGASGGSGPTTTTSPDQAAQPGTPTSSPGPQDAAATPSGEIVVTAQRRAERQVNVPISITALNPQQLTDANVQNLGDIQKVTPGLRFDNQAGFSQPAVRGVGTAITTSGGGSNVGIYIDGFYSPNPLVADFQLTKVTSIQVLKGPQGTLFGHNTTGGAILVTTAEPSEHSEVDLKASYGRFNAQRYQGYATAGVAPGIAVDLEGIYAKGNGFITNIMNGDRHVGKYENWTVRGGVKAELSDSVSVLARYQHSRVNDPSAQMLNSNTDTTIDLTTGLPWGVQTRTVPGTFTTNPNQIAANSPRFIRTTMDIAQLTFKADLGFANLASYSQYRKENISESEDLDQTGLPVFQIGIPVVDETWTQEFLLSSKTGPRLQWTAGLFFFSNKDTWITNVNPGSFFGFNPLTGGALTQAIRLGGSGTTTQSYAGFVDATYEVADRLFLTAGVRYSHDLVKNAYWNSSFTNIKNFVPGISSNQATPRAVIRYKPDDQSSIYASYTRGYKAAIIDVGGSCQDGPPAGNFTCNPVKPETIDAFEVGYKFDNRRFSFETAAFYYNYKNLQVSEFLGNAQAFIVNAAKSEIYGLDAELHYNLADRFQLNLGGSWTHGRYKQFGGQIINGNFAGAPIYASCPANPAILAPKYQAACNGLAFVYVNTDTVLRNVHMQHMPDFTANAGARYTTGMTSIGEFSLSGNLYYSSSFFFSPSGTQFRQPSYATLALRLEWNDPSRRYMIALFGDNVTNERYRTQVQYNSFGIGAAWSMPTTWGIEAGVKF
jgi:iron complex outermembrane recepter protein